jgi:hypothetical protein
MYFTIWSLNVTQNDKIFSNHEPCQFGAYVNVPFSVETEFFEMLAFCWPKIYTYA